MLPGRMFLLPPLPRRAQRTTHPSGVLLMDAIANPAGLLCLSHAHLGATLVPHATPLRRVRSRFYEGFLPRPIPIVGINHAIGLTSPFQTF